jgi:hypothetical protein
METPVKLSFHATIHRPDGTVTTTVHGRVAWAILSLIRAGGQGCTPISRPAPRWSDYVLKARRQGFDIETVHEGHDGPFAGHHGRYILHDTVTVSGGTLAEYLASPEGRRDFPNGDAFLRRAA